MIKYNLFMKDSIKSLLETYKDINKKIKKELRGINEFYKNIDNSNVDFNNHNQMYETLFRYIRNAYKYIFTQVLEKMEENEFNKTKYLCLKESFEEVINEENEKINKINNKLKEKMILYYNEINNLLNEESSEFKSILNKAILCEWYSTDEIALLEYYHYLIKDLVEIKLIGNDLEYKLLSNGEILNHYQMVRYLIKNIYPVCRDLQNYINLYQLPNMINNIENTEKFLLKLKYAVC